MVSMIFGSFDPRDEFFAKHQLINFYDVMVMALDQGVITHPLSSYPHD